MRWHWDEDDELFLSGRWDVYFDDYAGDWKVRYGSRIVGSGFQSANEAQGHAEALAASWRTT